MLGHQGVGGRRSGEGGQAEGRHHAQVAQDDPLAQQGRGVGCLHRLLRLGLLTFNLRIEVVFAAFISTWLVLVVSLY